MEKESIIDWILKDLKRIGKKYPIRVVGVVVGFITTIVSNRIDATWGTPLFLVGLLLFAGFFLSIAIPEDEREKREEKEKLDR